MSTIDKVREFHNTFGHPVATEAKVPSAAVRLLRFKLLLEEVLEFGRAVGVAGLADVEQSVFEDMTQEALEGFRVAPEVECDLVDAADALGDIDYVCQGANLVFGFPADAVIEEIHRANMSKLDATGCPVILSGGKIGKSELYTAPNIAAVLRAK